MKKFHIVMVCILVLMLPACVSRESMNWMLVGGSKADGNVILGIDVPAKMGITETIVEWSVDQANTEARRRCLNWGYHNAEVYRAGQFPVLKTCYAQGISPCWSKTYRVQYQCVD